MNGRRVQSTRRLRAAIQIFVCNPQTVVVLICVVPSAGHVTRWERPGWSLCRSMPVCDVHRSRSASHVKVGRLAIHVLSSRDFQFDVTSSFINTVESPTFPEANLRSLLKGHARNAKVSMRKQINSAQRSRTGPFSARTAHEHAFVLRQPLAGPVSRIPHPAAGTATITSDSQ